MTVQKRHMIIYKHLVKNYMFERCIWWA